MTPVLILAAALAAAPSPATNALPAATGAFEALTQAGKDAPLCTADGDVCVTGTREGAFSVTRKGKALAQWTAEPGESDDRFAPLPTMLRLDDGRMLVGVGVVRSQMYSGGNAQVVFQRLMLLSPGKAPVQVLEVPYNSEISIRACFDEKDMKNRLDACADEYSMETYLKPVNDRRDALPDLMLSVMATTFPRGVSRTSDSLAQPPLKKEDLIEDTDEACSYVRTFRFDAASATYRPDKALPACEQYTVP